MNKKLIFSTVTIIILGVAWWLISPLWNNVRLEEDIPLSTITSSTPYISIEKEKNTPINQPKIGQKANLIAKAHEVAGEVFIVETENEKILRFENLKTINGPDLRIYLAADLNAKDFIDLGKIRATEGSVNYPIPAGTDLTKYRYVLIWCRAFSVLFSYGELKYADNSTTQ